MTSKIDTQSEFAQFAGDLAERLSFNKSIGQIYGLLYMSPTALSLPEIAERLDISKGNVSLNIRILETWGAVTQVSVQGSRRDHYQANTNIKELALKRIQEGLGRRLDMAEERLNHLLENVDSGSGLVAHPEMKQKLMDLKEMLSKGRKGLNSLSKIAFLITG